MFGLKSMVSKFAFWSVVLLALAGVTLYKATWNNQNASTPPFTYWKGEYRDIAAALAPDATVRQAALDTNVSEVQQVTVLQFPLLKTDGTSQQRVDRCQSCHTGLLDPNMTAEKIIKFRDNVLLPSDQVGAYLSDPRHKDTLDAVKTLGAHPGIRVETVDNPHDLGVIHGDKFTYGITTEASVTDQDKADYQRQKVNLKQHPFPTFGCTTCHYGNGRELIQDSAHGSVETSLTPLLPVRYMEAACAQCHAQYDQKNFTISYQQPLSPARIIKILDGQDVAAPDTAAYLTQHPQTAAAVQYVADQPWMQMLVKGQALFKSQACYGCHKIEGFSKGNVGPELTYEGKVAGGTVAIAHQIWDPRYKVASCVMPYFFSVRQHNTDLPPGGLIGSPTAETNIVDPRADPKHPDAVKQAAVAEEGTVEYNEEIADTLRQHGYIPDAARQQDVDALVTFVASQTGQNYADSQASRFTTIAAYNIARPADVPVTVAAGKTLFESSGCYSCHYIGNPDVAHTTGDARYGKGGIAGPELSWEGTRHSQKWLVEHYKNPQAFVPGSIMPIFPFSDSQRAALSAYDASLRPAKAGAHLVSPDQDLPKDYKDQ